MKNNLCCVKKMRQRICWRINGTGYSGHGEWFMNYDESELQKEVDRLNKELPSTTHWIEKEMCEACEPKSGEGVGYSEYGGL